MIEGQEAATDVVVAGGGPTGLMLACELALAGVRTVVLERQRERPGFCRGFNLNARSLELLDRRGLVERFLAEGWRVPVTGFAGLATPLSLAELDSDHGYTFGIPQTRIEELIEQRANELGVPIRRGHEVIALEQDGDGVTIGVRGPDGDTPLRATYLAVWSDRVDIVVAKCPEENGIDALLIRPDGYTGWIAPAGSGEGHRGLNDSLLTWCGLERR